MLDKLSPAARHLALLVISAVLGWAGTDLVPSLQGNNPIIATLVGALVTMLIAYVTPLTRQYGVGQDDV